MKIIEIYSKHAKLKINQTLGATAYSWQHKNKEILFAPPIEEQLGFRKLFGIPLMYPFANRIVPAGLKFQSFDFQSFDSSSSHWLKDGNGLIMHGMTWNFEHWSYLPEKSSLNKACFSLKWDSSFTFFKYLPLIHTVELLYELTEQGLRVETTIVNLDKAPLPISYGFHPYFLINRKNDALNSIKIPAKKFYENNKNLLPTGKLIGTESLFKNTDFHALNSVELDTCFTELIRTPPLDFSVELKTKDYALSVVMDKVYQNTIVYLPKDVSKPYICIEPMIGSTNAWHQHFDSLPLLFHKDTHHSYFEINILD